VSARVRRALRHLAETGGYLPGVDPIQLGRDVMGHLVALGWATADASGWLVTPAGLVAHQRELASR
jgi:hypothetical protein